MKMRNNMYIQWLAGVLKPLSFFFVLFCFSSHFVMLLPNIMLNKSYVKLLGHHSNQGTSSSIAQFRPSVAEV